MKQQKTLVALFLFIDYALLVPCGAALGQMPGGKATAAFNNARTNFNVDADLIPP